MVKEIAPISHRSYCNDFDKETYIGVVVVPLSYALPENVNGHGLLEGGDGVHHSFINGNDEAPSQILQGRNGSSKHLYRLGWVV